MAWHAYGDPVAPVMLPLTLERNGSVVKISAPAATPSGVYRMRLWIVPARDTRLPESLGGRTARRDRTLFLVRFHLSGDYGLQTTPNGDAFVAVHRTSAGSVAVTIPDQRDSFWRGEEVHLLVHARCSGTVSTLTATLTITHEQTGQAVASRSAQRLSR